jgi:hypothetical protein
MAHRSSPSARSTGAALRSVALVTAFAALGATGCHSWRSVYGMGVPGAKLDKQLEGEDFRYKRGDEIVETKILKAKSPYIQVPGERDPETGEKKERDVLDLRYLDRPEVKVTNREAKIGIIVTGSTTGAVAVGVVLGLFINGMAQLGNSLSHLR